MDSISRLYLGIVVLFATVAPAADSSPTVDEAARDQQVNLERIREGLDERIEAEPRNVDLYSARGDVLFFLGQFEKAVEDYAKMVELRPSLADSHWRLGIARYFAKDFQAAAKQFEQYHSHDDVDRENGIWRYLSQRQAFGEEYARKDLLKYRKDDRPPFAMVYAMFSGTLSPDEVVQKVTSDVAMRPETRGQQEFYMNLYVGLFLQQQKQAESARRRLRLAAASDWPQKAGYGPEYMRQVARLAAAAIPPAEAE